MQVLPATGRTPQGKASSAPTPQDCGDEVGLDLCLFRKPKTELASRSIGAVPKSVYICRYLGRRRLWRSLGCNYAGSAFLKSSPRTYLNTASRTEKCFVAGNPSVNLCMTRRNNVDPKLALRYRMSPIELWNGFGVGIEPLHLTAAGYRQPQSNASYPFTAACFVEVYPRQQFNCGC